MDPKSKDRLKTLITRVLSYDSRQVLIELNRHKPSKAYAERYITDSEVAKREITSIFEENQKTFPTPESIESYALKYLRQQEKIAKGVNPSFGVLRKRLETGQYDILSSIGLSEYGEKSKAS